MHHTVRGSARHAASIAVVTLLAAACARAPARTDTRDAAVGVVDAPDESGGAEPARVREDRTPPLEPPATLPEPIAAVTSRPWGAVYPEPPALSEAVVAGVTREIAASDAVRAAYAKLDAGGDNIAWFEGIESLERLRATWCLQSCLAHPHPDVQIRALRALGGVASEDALPHLLRYAKSMAVFVDGSEGATLHGIIHHECARTLAAITGLRLELREGQDPEGLNSAVAAARTWMTTRRR